MTSLALRVESDLPHAFDSQDELLLQAFAWQVATSYVHASGRQQALRNAQLQERQRIAADLHDSVSQRLFSAQLLLRTAVAQLRELTDNVPSTILRVEELLRDSQQEMRDFVRALRRDDSQSSLYEALRDRVRTLRMQQGIQVSLAVDDSNHLEPDPPIRLALLAILDEALHNALKHADAKSITVRCDQTTATLVVRVEDDGVGLPDAAIGKGFGTRTMVERARAIGGAVAFRRSPTGGTVVEVQVPIHAPEKGDGQT